MITKGPVFLFITSLFFSFQLVAQNPVLNFAVPMPSTSPGGGISKKVVTDGTGNSYITGAMQGTTDFDPSASVVNLASAGDADVFLAKYDLAGNYIWAFSLGTAGNDQGVSIAIDGNGFIYLTGFFIGTMDMNPQGGVANISAPAGGTFVAKYDNAGNYVWAFALSGPSPTSVTDIQLDINNNVVITGSYGNTVDFDPSAGVANLTMGSGVTYDVYVAKYDAGGNYVWARGLDAAGSTTSSAIATDISGNVYIAGSFNGTTDFDPGGGAVNLTASTPGNMFLAKYSSAGNYTWALNIGDAANNEAIQDITIDGIGNIVTTGSFSGTNATDFNPGAGTDNHTPFSAVYTDGFVAKYSPAGIYIWANSFGGSHNDIGLGISTDLARNVYVTGYFNDTVDFDPSVAVSSLVASGVQADMFMVKYSLTGNLTWAARMGGTSGEEARSITLDNNGKLWVTGTFQSAPADFDPSASTFNLSAPGPGTLFLAKYEYCTPLINTEVLHTDISCFNGNNGLIHLHTDGTGPFTYNWQPSGGTDSIALNLTAGTYTCTTTSACGTVATISVSLTQPSQLVPFTVSQTNIFCFGDSTGSATIDANGGVAPYNYSWLPGGMTSSAITNLPAATYTCTVTDDALCTATYTITIAQPAEIGFTQSPQLCAGDSLVVGTNTYYTTGTYTDVFTAFNGCDSTVTTQLTINPAIDTSFVVTGITLTSGATASTYQWVDCNNAFAPIGGQTSQSFTPTANGNYAVVITQNGCSDTSACYSITTVGIQEEVTEVVVYPNPFTGYFNLDKSKLGDQVVVYITDMSGKIVEVISTYTGNMVSYYPKAPAGIYLLHVIDKNKSSILKLIKSE